ncbi:MAG: HAMP domain-containing protein, partial [Myxococcales bacterium]|nr:HAMP domain-containing protein [Myxococcales bacterium]
NPDFDAAPDDDLFQFTRDDQSGALVTVVPLTGPDGRRVGLELATPSAREQAYLALGMRRFAIVSSLLLVVAGLMAVVAGRMWIGRPLDALSAQTLALARGEFVHSELTQDDEIGELGRALDQTADQLAAARAALEHETRERIHTLERLRHADRLATVGTLAAGVAHELGTPLHVIAGRAQRIARGADGISDAKIIVEQCEHVQEIVRGLLDFARPRERERVEVVLPQLLTRTVSMIEPLLRRHAARVEIVVEAEPGPMRAAPGQLQQVFINLLVNAAQAMNAEKGDEGGEVRVTIIGCQDPPDDARDLDSKAPCFTRVRVDDEGPGIDPKTLEQIYDPFFTTKEPGEGTGLGLSIAYGIIHDHGGWIVARNREEGGASFEIWLPEYDPEAPPSEPQKEEQT